MPDDRNHTDESDRKRKGAAVAAGVTAAAVAAAVIAGTEAAGTDAAAGGASPGQRPRDPFDDLVPMDPAGPTVEEPSTTAGTTARDTATAVPPSGAVAPAPSDGATTGPAPAGAGPVSAGSAAVGIGAAPTPAGGPVLDRVEPADPPAPLQEPSSDAGDDPTTAMAGRGPLLPDDGAAVVEPSGPDDSPEPPAPAAGATPEQFAPAAPPTLPGPPQVSLPPDELTGSELPRVTGDGDGGAVPMPGIREFIDVEGTAAPFVPDGGPEVVPPPMPTAPPGFGAPPRGVGTRGQGAPTAEQGHNPLNDIAATQAAQAAAQAAAQGAASMAAAPEDDGGLPPGQPEQTFTIDVVVVGEGDSVPGMPPLAPGQVVATPVLDPQSALARYGDIPLNQLDAEDVAEVRAALGLEGPRSLQAFMQDGSTLAEVFEAKGVDINTALAGVDIDIPTLADPLTDTSGSTVGGAGPSGAMSGVGVTTDHTDYGNVLPQPAPTHFVPWDAVITEDHSTPQLDDNGFGAIGDSGEQIQWPEEWTL